MTSSLPSVVAHQGAAASESFGALLVRYLRLVIVAGIPVGLVVGGIGSRLAMLVLRVTSDPSVIGMVSDDGFVIGRFSVGDTIDLLQLGAFVGVIGATTYLLVRRWLLGPIWFQDLTVGLGSGAVVGSMLLHAEGVDFRVLTPRWLAMALFVALPAAFGWAMGPMVRLVEQRRPRSGWRQWVVPALLLAVGPGGAVALVLAGPVLFVYTGVKHGPVHGEGPSPAVGVVIRGLWLTLALAGLWALVGDIRAISALP